MKVEHDALVTVATASNTAAAELYRATLEQAGIPAVVADAGVVSANWLWGVAVGGIKVQVGADLEAVAREVLTTEASPVEASERELLAMPAPACPACGGASVAPYRGTQGRNIFLGLASYFLFFFPVLLRETRLVCEQCGHRFPRP